MTDAEATVRHCLIDGLSEQAHLSGIRADWVGRLPTEALVDDLMTALFAPGVRWAVQAYAAELDGQPPFDPSEGNPA